jgi:hypothetical protein
MLGRHQRMGILDFYFSVMRAADWITHSNESSYIAQSTRLTGGDATVVFFSSFSLKKEDI